MARYATALAAGALVWPMLTTVWLPEHAAQLWWPEPAWDALGEVRRSPLPQAAAACRWPSSTTSCRWPRCASRWPASARCAAATARPAWWTARTQRARCHWMSLPWAAMPTPQTYTSARAGWALGITVVLLDVDAALPCLLSPARSAVNRSCHQPCFLAGLCSNAGHHPGPASWPLRRRWALTPKEPRSSGRRPRCSRGCSLWSPPMAMAWWVGTPLGCHRSTAHFSRRCAALRLRAVPQATAFARPPASSLAQGFQGEFLWSGTSDCTAIMAAPTGGAGSAGSRLAVLRRHACVARFALPPGAATSAPRIPTRPCPLPAPALQPWQSWPCLSPPPQSTAAHCCARRWRCCCARGARKRRWGCRPKGPSCRR